MRTSRLLLTAQMDTEAYSLDAYGVNVQTSTSDAMFG